MVIGREESRAPDLVLYLGAALDLTTGRVELPKLYQGVCTQKMKEEAPRVRSSERICVAGCIGGELRGIGKMAPEIGNQGDRGPGDGRRILVPAGNRFSDGHGRTFGCGVKLGKECSRPCRPGTKLGALGRRQHGRIDHRVRYLCALAYSALWSQRNDQPEPERPRRPRVVLPRQRLSADRLRLCEASGLLQ